MSDAERIYAIDRFEGPVAVLVPDAGHLPDENVPRSSLPAGASAGDVLRVPPSAAGTPDWRAAAIDPELRRARLEEARDRLDRLGKRDPGGDIAL